MPLKLNKNCKYLLGCSYGPDSMALFSMLQKEGYNFAVAHVNYGIRKEAKDETDGLKKYCTENNIKIYVLRVKELPDKANLEAECRKIRYQFFARVVKRDKYDAVLIAHNEDDVIETYIMQKNRKSLVKHFGIAEFTTIYDTNVVRPILNKPKADLIKYCDKNKVPYAIDNSNLTDEFERNRIRHSTVSKMGKEKRRSMILEIAAKNHQLEVRDSFLQNLDLNNVEVLKVLDSEYLAVALNFLIKRHDPTLNVSMALSEEIRKILLSKKPNVRLTINSHLVFEKSYDSCHFLNIDVQNYSYILKRPEILDTPFFFADFRNGGEKRNIKFSDYPITIRRANPNDVVRIRNYDVTVRRLFIDWKVPLSVRDIWPIIISNKGEVLYIPRYQKDFKKATDLDFYVK